MTQPLETRLAGSFRAPRNVYQAAGAGESIHNDTVASKLGFKGGTVPGSIHMDQFAPLLVRAHGLAWFETGGMSLYFTKATTDGERVQAAVEPGEPRSRLEMFDDAGERICEGTAATGGLDAGSELRRRIETQTPAPRQTMRILAALEVGEERHDLAVRITAEQQAERLKTITEPLAAYEGAHGILPPSQIVHLAHQTRASVLANQRRAVGLFGALETQVFDGPLRADTDYTARTRVLKLTQSPRTENIWYEVVFREPGGARDLGLVLYYLRFMKASSPLWAE